MHAVKVSTSLSGAPVTPLPFPTLQLRQRTVHPDKEHVKRRKQPEQIGQPLLVLNDVIHDQIVAGLGEADTERWNPSKTVGRMCAQSSSPFRMRAMGKALDSRR